MYKDNKVKLRLPYFLLMLFIGIPFISGTSRQYIVIFVVALLVIIFNFTYKIKIRSNIEKLPIWFLGFWVYGIVIGFVRGNNPSDIIQNFAGLIVYILGVLLLNAKRFNLNALYKALYVASIIICFEIVIVFFFRVRNSTLPWPLSNVRYNSWTNSIYTGIAVLVFVLEAVSLWNLLHENERRNKIKSLFLLLLSAVSVFSTMDSGGYILGYAVVLAIILILSLKTNKSSRKYWILSSFFLLIVLAFALYYESRTGIATSVFSFNSSGNAKRYYQFGLVMERFKMFGNGLGSHLTYSYGIRNYDSYGLEVSYLNLIDKFGIFGFVLLFLYIYSFINPIQMIARGRGITEYNVMTIGLQGYFFVALGNPVLYAPYNVLLHVFAILFMSYNTRLSKKTLSEVCPE